MAAIAKAAISAQAGAPAGAVLRLANGNLGVAHNGSTPDTSWLSTIKSDIRPEMCAGCMKLSGYMSFQSMPAGNVQSMRWFDWTTMAMISAVFALTVWNEVYDIRLAAIQLWDCEAPLCSERQLMRVLIGFTEVVRHFLIVPLMLSTVPSFVLNDGGDALSQCLNTVAVLFILESAQ
jgi:hypothetical protein